VADLEAYVSNGPARQRRQHEASAPKIAGPGPGHNAFQMILCCGWCCHDFAGLALFLWRLVRRKNVLSVLAQCLGHRRRSSLSCGGFAATASLFHSGETKSGWSFSGRPRLEVFGNGRPIPPEPPIMPAWGFA